jgi:hypothetical protein
MSGIDLDQVAYLEVAPRGLFLRLFDFGLVLLAWGLNRPS